MTVGEVMGQLLKRKVTSVKVKMIGVTLVDFSRPGKSEKPVGREIP